MKDTEKVRVVILTDTYRIMGDITLEKGRRLTDHIVSSESFFAVTDAEVIDLSGRQVLTAAFLDVHRDKVQIVQPDTPGNLTKIQDEF